MCWFLVFVCLDLLLWYGWVYVYFVSSVLVGSGFWVVGVFVVCIVFTSFVCRAFVLVVSGWFCLVFCCRWFTCRLFCDCLDCLLYDCGCISMLGGGFLVLDLV